MCDNSESMKMIVNLLQKIDRTINENVLPRLTRLESRLSSLEQAPKSEQFVELVDELKESTRSMSSIRSDSISDIQSEHSSESDNLVSEKHGLVMSDCDMEEFATQTGKKLNCAVAMFDYDSNTLDPTLFNNKLEFVLIQDSGKVLDKYSEITKQVVEEMTSHVNHLVKVAMGIMEYQPDTKVFLGSLPPRFDGRLKVELVKLFNSILITETMVDDKVGVINQDQLQSRDRWKLQERYDPNLVTLTRYGKSLRIKNTAMQIGKVVPGLTFVQKKKHHPRSESFKMQGGPRYYDETKQRLKHFITECLHNF